MQSLLFNQCLLPQPPHFPWVSRLLLACRSPFLAPRVAWEGTHQLGGTWAKAGSSPGLSRLHTAPNPSWYLCHSLGSVKQGKLFPGLICHPCFNLEARPPAFPPPPTIKGQAQRWRVAGVERIPIPTQSQPVSAQVVLGGTHAPPKTRGWMMGSAKSWSRQCLAHLSAAWPWSPPYPAHCRPHRCSPAPGSSRTPPPPQP